MVNQNSPEQATPLWYKQFNKCTTQTKCLNKFGVQQLKFRIIFFFFTNCILHFLNYSLYLQLSYVKVTLNWNIVTEAGLQCFFLPHLLCTGAEFTKLLSQWVADTLYQHGIKWPDCDKHSHRSHNEVKNMCNSTPS